jgi:uncharacterized protein
MKCPTCPDSILIITDKKSVEIDFCPNCRGVWLDRGELDKLIALSTEQNAPQQYSAAQHRPDFVDSDAKGSYSGHAYTQRRRKSWLNDIFD